MPGVGGFTAATGVQLPLVGKVASKAGAQPDDGLSWLAPAIRLASVAVPCLILEISVLPASVFRLAAGICQTLASYLSTQTRPTLTESGGHACAAPTRPA